MPHSPFWVHLRTIVHEIDFRIKPLYPTKSFNPAPRSGEIVEQTRATNRGTIPSRFSAQLESHGNPHSFLFTKKLFNLWSAYVPCSVVGNKDQWPSGHSAGVMIERI